MIGIVYGIHILGAIILILIVLLQQGKGAGMGAAFGGASQTVFGATGRDTFLTRVTIGVASLFLITSLFLSWYVSTGRTKRLLEKSPGPSSSAPAPSVPSPTTPLPPGEEGKPKGAEPESKTEEPLQSAPVLPSPGEPSLPGDEGGGQSGGKVEP